jgi:predicted nucleic acid-binding Zn ribbon protein
MTTVTEARACLSCARPVKGRTDKKFCDDYCRNHFNNERKARIERNMHVKRINAVLLKNRQILETLLAEETTCVKVSREQLQWLGFQFRYSTHTQVTENGKRIFFCYDYGCVQVRPGWFMISKKGL